MRTKRAWLLIAAAAWTLFVWISRILIMVRQEATAGFKIVHFALAGISIAFALAVGWIGILMLRKVVARPPQGTTLDR